MTIRIGFGNSVHLGQRDRLNHVEPFGRAIPQVPIGLLAVQPVKQFPGGVAHVKERLAIGGGQMAVVFANHQVRQAGGDRCAIAKHQHRNK